MDYFGNYFLCKQGESSPPSKRSKCEEVPAPELVKESAIINKLPDIEEESEKAEEETKKEEKVVKLQKCSNLTDLRAQLLKFKQCESKLSEFRSSIKDAQFEAEAAAALVVKSKGGIPSPCKTLSECIFFIL